MKFIIGNHSSRTQALLIELGANPADFQLDKDELSFEPNNSSEFSVSEVDSVHHAMDGYFKESQLKYGETLIGTKAPYGVAQIKTDQIQSLIEANKAASIIAHSSSSNNVAANNKKGQTNSLVRENEIEQLIDNEKKDFFEKITALMSSYEKLQHFYNKKQNTFSEFRNEKLYVSLIQFILETENTLDKLNTNIEAIKKLSSKNELLDKKAEKTIKEMNESFQFNEMKTICFNLIKRVSLEFKLSCKDRKKRFAENEEPNAIKNAFNNLIDIQDRFTDKIDEVSIQTLDILSLQGILSPYIIMPI